METLFTLLLTSPASFLLALGGIVLAITVHEFAHAWMADRLGDPTPRYQGRVTLDPRAHLDPYGTIALILTNFGWGRPVEFDPYNLKNPKRDTALIALAGPVSNLIIAGVISLLLNLIPLPGFITYALFQILATNVMLAIFNLVPVHPLDGSKIILPLLPHETALEYEQFMHRYGTILLIFLILPWNGSSPISQLIGPVISFVLSLLT